MCFWASSVAAAGRRGEGKFGRNAGGKALFSPHPALLFCLLFSSVFYSSVLRLGVRAPVCFVFARRGKRFVCFHDCQQTSGWKCLTTVRPFGTRKPAPVSGRKPPLPSQPSGKGGTPRRAGETWQKSYTFHKDGGSIGAAAGRGEGWRRPRPLHCVKSTRVKNVTCLGLLAMLAGKSWNVWNGGRWCFCSYLAARSKWNPTCQQSRSEPLFMCRLKRREYRLMR